MTTTEAIQTILNSPHPAALAAAEALDYTLQSDALHQLIQDEAGRLLSAEAAEQAGVDVDAWAVQERLQFHPYRQTRSRFVVFYGEERVVSFHASK